MHLPRWYPTVKNAESQDPMRLAIYIRSVQSARGAEQVSVNVARGLVQRGHQVDFLVEKTDGWLLDHLRAAGSTARIVDLQSGRRSAAAERIARFRAFALALFRPSFLPGSRAAALRPLLRLATKEDLPLLALKSYLETDRPDAIVSFLNYPNMALLLASLLCRHRCRTIVNVRNHMSVAAEHSNSRRVNDVPCLMSHLFPIADAVVAPSRGVAEDVSRITGLPRARLHVIYNPVFRPEIAERAAAPFSHPWFADGQPPVILGVGKLKPQKDFETLIRAVKRVHDSRRVRLIILGEGDDRDSLQALATQLGIGDDVDLAGQVDNPFPYYARADAFVLSSRWEGLPNVLIEAMACGCPVVSTDCPSGPNEIIGGTTLGKLVPIGDEARMAAAIEETLQAPPPRDRIVEHARRFSYDRAVEEYEAVLRGPQPRSENRSAAATTALKQPAV